MTLQSIGFKVFAEIMKIMLGFFCSSSGTSFDPFKPP